ncbi:hypothetical protein D9V32_05455 [Mycetocola tolaasinivorans]|uniref:Uncharacterized protein n=2 Tax=Mycetocola tolaasinivorans TaxID=76635 RepID=A0A3L7A7H7_9MICO|nr:hypothetical protein D9V32_05455 [Mycetocola tolaasinivorans]
MNGRLCARGCDREAVFGLLICERCSGRIRRALDEAAEVVEHLRSLNSPVQAVRYGREVVSGSGPGFGQAPMDLGPIDAADTIVSCLVHWAQHFGDTESYGRYRDGLESGTTLDEAWDVAKTAADYLADQFSVIAATVEVLDFMDALFTPPEGTWTIGKAISAYPTSEMPYRHANPCPACKRRTIQVAPPGNFGQDAKYQCLWETCGWTPPLTKLEQWRLYFDGPVFVPKEKK